MCSKTSNTHAIEIDEALAEYAAAAIMRLQYLYPAIDFTRSDGRILMESDSELPSNIRQEIAYALYREKIYSDNLEIRRSLYRRILET